MAPPLGLPNLSEDQVFKHLQVRLITQQHRPCWDALVCAEHDLNNAALVGEQRCEVAEYQGLWLALLGGSGPARHLRHRDAWMRWWKEPWARGCHLLASNAHLCNLGEAPWDGWIWPGATCAPGQS